MSTELEELVEFLHHGNTQIRQVAVDSLVAYSEKDPAIFKSFDYTPIRDLKLLIKDYPPIAKNALMILINISDDKEILKRLTEDEKFLETLVSRITNSKEPNANEIAMLLSNMAKNDSIERLFTLKRDPPAELSTSKAAIDQLMDCFVKGSLGEYNPKANFDYLAYLFADLAKFPTGSKYLLTQQEYDSVFPIAKLLPFTTHKSHIRRLGVASAIKNACFTVSAHPDLLSPRLSILPFILLPLASGTEDNYTEQESDSMIEELQLLDPSVEREKDESILETHLETLLLLTTTREGRDILREAGTYYVVRECHLHVNKDEVRDGCDRLVQVLMRDEEGEESKEAPRPLEGAAPINGDAGKMVTQREESDKEDDDDDKVVEIAL